MYWKCTYCGMVGQHESMAKDHIRFERRMLVRNQLMLLAQNISLLSLILSVMYALTVGKTV